MNHFNSYSIVFLSGLMYSWVWHCAYFAFQVLQGEKCQGIGIGSHLPDPLNPHTQYHYYPRSPHCTTDRRYHQINSALKYHFIMTHYDRFLLRIDYLMDLGIFWILGNFCFYFSNFHALFFQISIDGIRNEIPVNSVSTQVIKILGSGSELCILYMIHSDWWW